MYLEKLNLQPIISVILVEVGRIEMVLVKYLNCWFMKFDLYKIDIVTSIF